MELLYTLLVLLVVTRIFGELAERLGQPVLVGELVSGIALGLVVSTFSDTFPVLSGLGDDEVFHGITELAMFFLMLLAGLDLRPKEMAKASKEAPTVGVARALLAHFNPAVRSATRRTHPHLRGVAHPRNDVALGMSNAYVPRLGRSFVSSLKGDMRFLVLTNSTVK